MAMIDSVLLDRRAPEIIASLVILIEPKVYVLLVIYTVALPIRLHSHVTFRV